MNQFSLRTWNNINGAAERDLAVAFVTKNEQENMIFSNSLN